jgi:hypothetical protein
VTDVPAEVASLLIESIEELLDSSWLRLGFPDFAEATTAVIPALSAVRGAASLASLGLDLAVAVASSTSCTGRILQCAESSQA